MTGDWLIRQIEHRSPEYESALEIRRRLLREPLGLVYTEEDLEAERAFGHFVAMDRERVVGYLHLTPREDGWMQMKQVAVDDSEQGKGLGRNLVEHCERWARENGVRGILLHAREVVVGFYEKLGYAVEGSRFLEVGIPHWKMRKAF